MRRALPAVLLLSLLLAGCATLGGGEMTAKEAQGKADARARAWQADAVFRGLGTFEGNLTPEMRRSAENVTLLSDSVVGDGKAPQWIVSYASPSAHRELRLVVYGNGTSVVTEDVPIRGNGTIGAAPAWSIDSPRALELARSDKNVSEVLATPGAGVTEAVGGEPGENATWFLGAFAGTRFAGVLVDANSGALMPLPSYQNPFSPDFGASVAPTTYTFSGNLDATKPSEEDPFEVSASRHSLQVSFTDTSTVPTDQVTYKVLDTKGQALTKMGGSMPGMTMGNGDTYATTGPGTYKLVATLSSSAPPAPPVQGSYTATVTVY
jgi:hypothetical protein